MTRAIPWGLALILTACGEGEGPPAEATVSAEVLTHVVTTRDGRLSAALPIDLAVADFDRSLLATSADGSFRLHVERREGPQVKLTAVVGEFKDALAALGWVTSLEKHYEAAVQLQLVHGAKGHSTERGVWIVEKALDGENAVAICDGLARETQAERVKGPLRVICQSIAFAAGPR
jgi:hypothetical protein